MTLQELNQRLVSTGIPVAYRFFKDNDPNNPPPPLPFICYFCEGNNNFPADGVVFHSVKEIRVELYTKNKDINAEALVEAVLSDVFFNKTEVYIDTEKCYQIIYELEV